MNVAIELNSDELSIDLFNKIKELFQNKLIKIVISDNIDTTEYLMRNSSNYKTLINSLDETKTIDFTPESFAEYSHSLISE